MITDGLFYGRTTSCDYGTTEYTELQPLLPVVHSVMRVKLALAGEGGGCTPTPFYYIYHVPPTSE